MGIWPLPVALATKWIEEGHRFALACFDDPEFDCIKEANLEGAEDIEIGLRLEEVIRNPSITPCVTRTKIRKGDWFWLTLNYPEVAWANLAPFRAAHLDGTLGPFIDAVATKGLLYVGHSTAKEMAVKELRARSFIAIPIRDEFAQVERAVKETLEKLEMRAYALVGLDLGMSGKLVMDMLVDECPQVSVMDLSWLKQGELDARGSSSVS